LSLFDKNTSFLFIILFFKKKSFQQFCNFAYIFASTLPKPHEPTQYPKLCQRACKAIAPREIVLKNLPTLKKIKNADTRLDRKESIITMIRKLNIDNGLQDWKTEHQAVTSGIKHWGLGGYAKFLPRIKFGVTGQDSSPQSPTISYRRPLAATREESFVELS